jgi:hypothetical protein
LTPSIKDWTGGYNLWSKKALESIDIPSIFTGGYFFQIEMKYKAFRSPCTIAEIPIVFHDRVRGRSKMPPAYLIKALADVWRIKLYHGYSFAPFFLGLFWMIPTYKQADFSFYFGYTFSYILMVLFLSFSSSDSHYNVVLIPFFVPALTFFCGDICSAFSGIKKKNIALAFFSVRSFLKVWLSTLMMWRNCFLTIQADS